MVIDEQFIYIRIFSVFLTGMAGGNAGNQSQSILQTPALVAQLQRQIPSQGNMMGGNQPNQQQYSHQSQY